jgi:hypothetical protein
MKSFIISSLALVLVIAISFSSAQKDRECVNDIDCHDNERCFGGICSRPWAVFMSQKPLRKCDEHTNCGFLEKCEKGYCVPMFPHEEDKFVAAKQNWCVSDEQCPSKYPFCVNGFCSPVIFE